MPKSAHFFQPSRLKTPLRLFSMRFLLSSLRANFSIASNSSRCSSDQGKIHVGCGVGLSCAGGSFWLMGTDATQGHPGGFEKRYLPRDEAGAGRGESLRGSAEHPFCWLNCCFSLHC